VSRHRNLPESTLGGRDFAAKQADRGRSPQRVGSTPQSEWEHSLQGVNILRCVSIPAPALADTTGAGKRTFT